MPTDERLGLAVPPTRVRLHPSPADGYAWAVAASKRELLDCSLSNGTVGVYWAICEEIGESLEAITPHEAVSRTVEGRFVLTAKGNCIDTSSAAEVRRLEAENRRIQLEPTKTHTLLLDAQIQIGKRDSAISKMKKELGRGE